MKTLSILLTFFLLLCTSKLRSQERQIPFDSSGTLMTIDQEAAKQLGLFSEYSHFLEARLFQEADSSYVLEISTFENSQLLRQRIPKRAADVTDLRWSVAHHQALVPELVRLDQPSRSKFIIWESVLSTCAYGPLVISSFPSDNVGVGTGLELLIGGSGYLLSSVLTQNAPMTDGESSLALGGAFLGTVHGALLDELVSNGDPGNEIGIVSTVTSIGETVAGYEIARSNNMSEGDADIIRYGGLFGMLDGASVVGAIDNNSSGSILAGAALAGSAAGFWAGTAMAKDVRYNRGNASAVLTAGIYGPVVTTALYASAYSWNSNGPTPTGLYIASLAGNIGGVVLAHNLMRNRHLSTAEGTSVILGTTAGFLIGTGIGYIASSSNRLNTSPWAFTVPMALGTVAGYALSIIALGPGTGAYKDTGLRIDANPAGLMGALLLKDRTSRYNTPLLSLNYQY